MARNQHGGERKRQKFYQSLKVAADLLKEDERDPKGGHHGWDTIRYLIKIGVMDPSVMLVLEEAKIIEITGWTPKMLDEQDPQRMKALKTVWAAKPPKKRKRPNEPDITG